MNCRLSSFSRLLSIAALAVAVSPALLLAADTAPNTLTPAEQADGWVLLFDGETLFGWEPSAEANWKVEDGTIRVSEGTKGLLCTTSDWADYELKIDFRAAEKTNSGVFLRTPLAPKDPTMDCYELNIAAPDVSPFPTGSFVGRKKAAEANTYFGEWQSFDVTIQNGHAIIKLDGNQALDYTDPQPLGRGRIGLQFNMGPIEFKNIKLKPLGLKPIFNGKDLTGWKEHPGKASVFSVTEKGELNVKNGNGALESEGKYADFVLQLDVFVNGKGLNSGVFFRSIPGEFWNGYESQIQNAYKNGDPTQPADFGTGAIYRRVPARRIVAKDFEWFTKTLNVSGPHMAVWVNGYPVTDWEDKRPKHANPRQGKRLEAGTLIIQGHDPTTDLSFRNFKIQEMPRR